MKCEEYEDQIKIYIEATKTYFDQINEYNNRIISVGYAAFFAIATYVKDNSPRGIFLASIIFMSISVAIFVVHELCRAMYLSRYSSNSSRAIEDIAAVKLANDSHTKSIIKYQRYNILFYWSSLLTGLAGTVLIFLCYINMITK